MKNRVRKILAAGVVIIAAAVGLDYAFARLTGGKLSNYLAYRLHLSSCVEEVLDDKCTYASRMDLPTHQDRLIAQLREYPYKPPRKVTAGFPELLSRSLGFQAIRPAAAQRPTVSTIADGVQDVRLDYETPPLQARALYAGHPQPAKELVMIFHGVNSTEDKVMGFDNKDYMDQIGKVLFDRGYDVLAVNATSDTSKDTIFNLRLRLFGTTRDGWSVRTACDFIDALSLRDTHERIYVYGLSNGAALSLYAGTLCEGIDLVIADQGFPWLYGDDVWDDPADLKLNLKWGIKVDQIVDRSGVASPADYAFHVKAPTYIIDAKDFIERLRRQFSEAIRLGGRPKSEIYLVEKGIKYHMPEIEKDILPILSGKTHELGSRFKELMK